MIAERILGKKFVSSLMNVFLIIGVFIVLFPLATPVAKADRYIFWDDWEIGDTQSYDDDTFVLYKNLTIQDGGSLTLINCTIEMAYASNATENLIHVIQGGEFFILSNSLITTNSSNPDPYEFEVHGSLTIQSSTVENMAGNGVEIYSSDVSITDSTIRNGSSHGIYVSANGIIISGSNITENTESGIYLNNADNNEIYRNNISENRYGIHLNGSLGSHLNEIYYCNITNNEYGIQISKSNNNNIINNIVDSNQRYGIYVGGNDSYIGGNIVTNNTNIGGAHWYAGIVVSGNNNNITYNNCSYHYNVGTWHSGISIIGSPVVSNNISHNNVANNSIGFTLHSCRNNIIFGNTVRDNQYYGISSGGASAGSNNNTIEGNNIFCNGWYGILLSPYLKKYSSDEKIVNNYIENNTMDGACVAGTKNLNITGNHVINNKGNGIYIYNSSSSSNVDLNFTITHNLVFNNTHSGIALLLSNNITISDNNLSSNEHGVYLYKSSETHIKNNKIYNHDKACIRVISSSNNFIHDNPLLDNSEYGIHLSSSSKNYINSSYIANNTYGVILINSNYNFITDNNSLINNTDGIYLNGSSGSHWNIITNNNISNNTKTGVKLSNSDNNTICSNDILNNSLYGIALIDSYNNTICHNNIYGNGVYGLYIEGDYRNNITQDNTINGEYILYFHDLTGNSTLNATAQNNNLTAEGVTNVGKINFVECNHFYVSNNNISNATKGIFLYNSNNITIDNNIIYNIDEDGEYGIYIEEDYRHNITNTTTVNGENIYYYYNLHGTQSNLMEIVIPQSEQPLSASHVSNVGKISVIDCSYLLIKDKSLSNGYSGIFLYGSHETTILNNTISDSEEFGLYIGEGCQELTLWNNTVTNSGEVGLFITEGYYHHYIAENNSVNGENIYYFTDNTTDTFKDFVLTTVDISNVGKLSFINCSNLTIEDNTLNNNYGSGIFVYSSFNIMIRNNTATSNSNGVWLESSVNITITQNYFNSNTRSGYGIKAGIYLKYSHDNLISNNTIYDNGYSIYIEFSTNNTVSNHNDTIKDSIYVLHSSPHILNNNFTTKSIIRSYTSSPSIGHNNFYVNGPTILIFLKDCNSSARIYNNTIMFDLNVSKPISGLHESIRLWTSSPLIENNTSLFPYIPLNHSSRNVNTKTLPLGHIAVFYSSSPTIKNNYFYGGSWGISCETSSEAKIMNDTIEKTDIGINAASKPADQWGCGENVINTACNLMIEGNNIFGSHIWGINFNPYNNGTITNNTIVNSTGFSGWGIRIKGGARQYIASNNISYNDLGIKSYPGAPYPIIFNNTFTGNTIGLYTEGSDSSLKIEKNSVINNTYGISGWNHDNYIANNTLLSNDYGILVNGEGSPFIFNNILNSSTQNGINVTEGSSPIIRNNYINLSGSYGIYIKDSSNCLIYHNNFINNTIQANDTNPANNDWHHPTILEGNYWSDYNGSDDGSGSGKHAIAGDRIGDTEIPHPHPDIYPGYDYYPFIMQDGWLRVYNIDKDLWYAAIQTAVNDAESGNTLEAMAGTYNETVIVNKTVAIIGKYGASNTIINGNGTGDVVNITANWVNITGFTVTGSGSNSSDAGIELENAHNCHISNDTINNNSNMGIRLINSNDTKVTGNDICNSPIGVYVYEGGNNTEIANNTITNNSNGINIYWASAVMVEYNMVFYNTYGLVIDNSSPIIRYNNISYNYNGIEGVVYSNVTIGNNTITYNECVGISKIFFSNGTIDNNTISYNDLGILCDGSSPLITFNNITSNTKGIICSAEFVFGPYNASLNESSPPIRWNNIYGNDEYGLNNTSENATIDATHNYWGSPNGPQEGDIVEVKKGSVLYEPFETSPIEEAGPG